MNLSYRIYYFWRRNLVSYKRFIVPTLLVSMGEPLFYLITFGIGLGAYMGLFGGKSYLSFLAPGMIITSAMLSSTFECLYGSFVRMMHEKLYDSLIVTPLSAEDAIAGDIAWGTFRGMISGILMLAVAVLLGAIQINILNLVILLGMMVLIGFLFGSLAMIITSFAPNFDFFNYYTELFITPMFFFSGVFFPLDTMPTWVRTFALFLPLTHGVVIVRSILSNLYPVTLLYNLAALIIPGAIFFSLALIFMKRRLIK